MNFTMSHDRPPECLQSTERLTTSGWVWDDQWAFNKWKFYTKRSLVQTVLCSCAILCAIEKNSQSSRMIENRRESSKIQAMQLDFRTSSLISSIMRFTIEAIREFACQVAEWPGAKFIPESPSARVSQIPTVDWLCLSTSMRVRLGRTNRTYERTHHRKAWLMRGDPINMTMAAARMQI